MIVSIARALALLADEAPERPSVTHEARTVTRRELDIRSTRLAHAYAERGVSQDDFVAIALPNGIEFYAAAFATWKLGAIPLPISSRLPRAERDAILDVARPALVVGVEPADAATRPAVPAGFDASGFSDEPLPDRTASAWKAPTSGGSTGRPKVIVVLSSTVIGLPDEDLGQRIHAIVQLDGEVTDEELSRHLAERIARNKMPRSYERLSHALRDDAGKVRRSALRQQRV